MELDDTAKMGGFVDINDTASINVSNSFAINVPTARRACTPLSTPQALQDWVSNKSVARHAAILNLPMDFIIVT